MNYWTACVSGILPAVAVGLFKLCLKGRHLAGPINKLLQLGNLQIITIKAAILIEHLGEDAQDGRLVLFDRALGIDVEKDRIRRRFRTALQLCKHHRIIEFVHEVTPVFSFSVLHVKIISF